MLNLVSLDKTQYLTVSQSNTDSGATILAKFRKKLIFSIKTKANIYIQIGQNKEDELSLLPCADKKLDNLWNRNLKCVSVGQIGQDKSIYEL